MKIYIAGAGAMGCRFGYMLKKADQDVTLLDFWQEHIQKIQQDGLSIVGDVNDRISIPIGQPKDYTASGDLIILFTKAMGLANMLQHIQHLIGEKTKILCLLNGLGHEDVMAQYVDRSKILLGVTIWTAGLKGPGVALLQHSGTVNLQSLDPKGKQEAQGIVDVLNQAKLNVTYDEDVYPSLWKKACVNGTMNATCAITDATIGQFFDSKDGCQIVHQLIEEFVQVAKASGIMLDQQAITKYVFDSAAQLGSHYPSMHQDLIQNHRLTEVDYITGAVWKKGQSLGIATPYCAMLTQLIHAKERILGI